MAVMLTQVKEFRASKRILERLRRKQEQRELADSEAALQAEKVRACETIV